MTVQHRTLALTNVLLIDGTDAPAVAGATVVITGNEIAAAGTAVTIPERAEVVDLGGKTVLPGLIDAHVHLGGLGFQNTPPFGGRAATDDYAEVLAGALRHGVTTQRSLGDFLHDSIAVRDEIANGSRVGARIVTAGASFQVEGGHPNASVWAGDRTTLREAARTPRTADEAVRAVDELTAAGVDLIKIIISNNAMFGSPRPELKLPWHLTEVIVGAAHGNGLRVAAHTETLVDTRHAVEAGVDDIEHLLLGATDPRSLDESGFDELFAVMRTEGTYLVPTMVVRQRQADENTDARTLRHDNQLVRRAYEAGVRLGVGSDAHTVGMHGWKLRHEIVMMVHDQAIPAAAALVAATRTNAELLGKSDRLGTVEPGKLADLLVVAGNPLRDITALANVHQVISNGAVVVDHSRRTSPE